MPIVPMTCATLDADQVDRHIAFRGTFRSSGEPLELRLVGASEYLVWLDGKLIEDGPARFAKSFPEYQALTIRPGAGAHVLAVHLHSEGVTTRILSSMEAFLGAELVAKPGGAVPVSWKSEVIPGYASQAHRISDILGWIDWCDTRRGWKGWEQPAFDDSKWHIAKEAHPAIGEVTAAKTHPVRLQALPIKAIASGKLAEDFGYERDDPAVRFFLRNLNPVIVPSQGVWRRYDLGRVRLGRPKITLDVPAGAVVEFAMSEQLRHDRVHPFITLSGSPTCNFDHYVARGGVQEFLPFTPKGGRFLEIHVLSNRPVKFVKEEFVDRAYYGEPEGRFACSDPLLNRIWTVGVNTLRSCADDGLTDCPTRERGQWTGDVVSVATDICGVAYSDLSLSRRALVQAAQAARSDGLVAGVGPGDPGYLSTYAAQWVSACIHYWELTGDRSILSDLFPAAERNLAAFHAQTTKDGVGNRLGWAFVDWGYVSNEGPSDMALNIHYLMALRSMVRWCEAVGNVASASVYRDQARSIEMLVRVWLEGRLGPTRDWANVGYQRAALALLAGLVERAKVPACVKYIEAHLLSCFPNDPNGPRLSDPGVSNPRVMTPYFAHFAFQALLNEGEIGFVLREYRKCWGWALGVNSTTWLEVFDPRWSQCHEWSGCPTWQLTRYALGLRPRFDLGVGVFDVHVLSGDLRWASGTLPLPGGGSVSARWTAENGNIRLRVTSGEPIRLRIGGKIVPVNRHFETVFSKKSAASTAR